MTKTIIYNGNDIFKVNCNLYGEEYIKPQETLEAIKDGFYFSFESDLRVELDKIGLKFISLKIFSPREYNFAGDSIDLEIDVIDPAKYIEAVAKNETEINKLLEANKSYDGYFARTVASTVEEIKNAKEDPDFSPDVICLSYLLTKKIDFAGGIDIYDYYVYDYDCENDGCDNQKEDYSDSLCPACQAKEAKK
jgi:hypothetical protein